MKEFTLEYVIAWLMHEMSMRKENKPQSEDSKQRQQLKLKGVLELW
jgi:hypothetical protein